MKKECLILSALISTASAFSQHKAPNIIFILCDDMGYIIRKSKFPPNPERSVQFSGKRTKRSVQKKGCTQHL